MDPQPLMTEPITIGRRDRLTAAALPDQFAGLRRGKVTPHPPTRPEMGVSVAYVEGDVTGRVALYDRGLADIPPGPESSAIYDEVNRVLADLGERVEIGVYEGAHIIDQYLTRGSESRVNFFCVEYEYCLHGECMRATVCLTGHAGLIVMVSCEQPLASADTDTQRAFVADVGAFLARQTSGPKCSAASG